MSAYHDPRAILDPLIYSNTTIGARRLTWRELAEHTAQLGEQYRDWAIICADLDRCEHGRHEGDACFGCGGTSKGNPLLLGTRQIGFTMDGHKIVVPHRDGGKSDPANWRQPRRPPDPVGPATAPQ
jgi:hypothetical protein